MREAARRSGWEHEEKAPCGAKKRALKYAVRNLVPDAHARAPQGGRGREVKSTREKSQQQESKASAKRPREGHAEITVELHGEPKAWKETTENRKVDPESCAQRIRASNRLKTIEKTHAHRHKGR